MSACGLPKSSNKVYAFCVNASVPFQKARKSPQKNYTKNTIADLYSCKPPLNHIRSGYPFPHRDPLQVFLPSFVMSSYIMKINFIPKRTKIARTFRVKLSMSLRRSHTPRTTISSRSILNRLSPVATRHSPHSGAIALKAGRMIFFFRGYH